MLLLTLTVASGGPSLYNYDAATPCSVVSSILGFIPGSSTTGVYLVPGYLPSVFEPLWVELGLQATTSPQSATVNWALTWQVGATVFTLSTGSFAITVPPA